MTIELPESLVQRIQAAAARKGQSPADLLGDLLTEVEDHTSEVPGTVAAPGTLDALIEVAERTDLGSTDAVDTSIRSREILHTEFADYLKRRMEQDDNASTD